jgi:hypothetical protein
VGETPPYGLQTLAEAAVAGSCDGRELIAVARRAISATFRLTAPTFGAAGTCVQRAKASRPTGEAGRLTPSETSDALPELVKGLRLRDAR